VVKISNLRDEGRAMEWLAKGSGREVYEVQNGFSPSNNDVEALIYNHSTRNPRKKLSKQARKAILYRRHAIRRLG
jgi:hypothetical protein